MNDNNGSGIFILIVLCIIFPPLVGILVLIGIVALIFALLDWLFAREKPVEVDEIHVPTYLPEDWPVKKH